MENYTAYFFNSRYYKNITKIIISIVARKKIIYIENLIWFNSVLFMAYTINFLKIYFNVYIYCLKVNNLHNYVCNYVSINKKFIFTLKKLQRKFILGNIFNKNIKEYLNQVISYGRLKVFLFRKNINQRICNFDFGEICSSA